MKKNHIRDSIVKCFIVALLISHIFLLQGCWFKGDKKFEESEENNTIESLDAADIIDMDDIEELISAGKIKVCFDKNNEIRSINGQFTDKPLNSVEDAVQILKSVSALCGNKFVARKDSIKSKKEGDFNNYTRYTLDVILNGVTIPDGEVVLIAEEGKAYSLDIYYDKKLDDDRSEGNNVRDSQNETDIIDMDEIETLISLDKIKVSFGKNNEIRSIDGQFTDKSLNSIEDAVQILNSICTLCGNKFDARRDFITVETVSDVGETCYTLNARLNGITIPDSDVVLVAKEGKVDRLYITYDPKFDDIDAKITITEEEAKKIASEDYFAMGVTGGKRMDIDVIASLRFGTFGVDDELNVIWKVQIINDNESANVSFGGRKVSYSIMANGQNAGDIIGKDDGIYWD